MMVYKRADLTGKSLGEGDSVVVREIPPELTSGLPEEDQTAIMACVGGTFSISGFDSYGHAELEFTDAAGVMHTIWIRPDCLEST